MMAIHGAIAFLPTFQSRALPRGETREWAGYAVLNAHFYLAVASPRAFAGSPHPFGVERPAGALLELQPQQRRHGAAGRARVGAALVVELGAALVEAVDEVGALAFVEPGLGETACGMLVAGGSSAGAGTHIPCIAHACGLQGSVMAVGAEAKGKSCADDDTHLSSALYSPALVSVRSDHS